MGVTATRHTPVLLNEVVELLKPDPHGVVLDGTIGTGGHGEALLVAAEPTGRLLGLDLDERALTVAQERLNRFGDRVRLTKASFHQAPETLLEHRDFQPVTSILLDLGTSALTLTESGRGFSFQHPSEPLDMRYGPASAVKTAAEILATGSEETLTRIIREYGEEPLARRIARRIVERRRTAPVATVGDLVEIVLSVYGRRAYREISRRHPATRTFQALRIAVNHELDVLAEALPKLLEILPVGGRIAVISFHSLEDRIVKTFFQREARDCICPPELPICQCGHRAHLTIVTKHVITPSAEERRANPWSRSAKLRVAEKIP